MRRPHLPLPHIDWLVVNEHELAALCQARALGGIQPLDRAKAAAAALHCQLR